MTRRDFTSSGSFYLICLAAAFSLLSALIRVQHVHQTRYVVDFNPFNDALYHQQQEFGLHFHNSRNVPVGWSNRSSSASQAACSLLSHQPFYKNCFLIYRLNNIFLFSFSLINTESLIFHLCTLKSNPGDLLGLYKLCKLEILCSEECFGIRAT